MTFTQSKTSRNGFSFSTCVLMAIRTFQEHCQIMKERQIPDQCDLSQPWCQQPKTCQGSIEVSPSSGTPLIGPVWSSIVSHGRYRRSCGPHVVSPAPCDGEWITAHQVKLSAPDRQALLASGSRHATCQGRLFRCVGSGEAVDTTPGTGQGERAIAPPVRKFLPR
jgi:hypothetical protein